MLISKTDLDPFIFLKIIVVVVTYFIAYYFFGATFASYVESDTGYGYMVGMAPDTKYYIEWPAKYLPFTYQVGKDVGFMGEDQTRGWSTVYQAGTILACPGDTVKVSNGEVYVNDERADIGTTSIDGYSNGVTLDENEYFILPDHDSTDLSRYGIVKKENILGTIHFSHLTELEDYDANKITGFDKYGEDGQPLK